MKSKDRKSFINHSMVQMMCKMGGIGQRLCPLPIFLLKFQQARPSGCDFSLSRPREGRQLPSVRDANGGIFCVYLLE